MEYTDKKFSFGENWARYLRDLNEDMIKEAERSLQTFLKTNDLKGRSFLDIGSGSGLFSLAARRLGARVHSLDYDTQSVACTRELKNRFFKDDDQWTVEQASALNISHMRSLGKFDIVYSWGVLHHTGAMWIGIENAISCVAPGGSFFIAIYNDKGIVSHVWWLLKFIYNKLPGFLKFVFAYTLGFFLMLASLLKYTLLLKPMVAIRYWFKPKRGRGMVSKHDWIDWVGGFPYEFATYEVLEGFFQARDFELSYGEKCPSLGCHEQVFRKK